MELASMAWAKLSFTGGAAVIEKLDGGFELPPAGGGLKTVTLLLPPPAISLAAMATVIWVGEQGGDAKGVWGSPRKETVEPTLRVGLQLKPVPFTCRLNPGPPALALLEIGRASCRESVPIAVVGVAGTRK